MRPQNRTVDPGIEAEVIRDKRQLFLPGHRGGG